MKHLWTGAQRALLTGTITILWTSCGSSSPTAATTSGTNTGATPTGTAGASLADGYRQAKWQPGVTVSFTGSCTMTYTSTGSPSHGQAAYYLVPNPAAQTVATTPTGHLALSVGTVPVSSKTTTYTMNVCPTKSAAGTTTRLGSAGWTISGAAMFNAYEGDNVTIANADNVSYNFVDANGAAQTAAFLDSCNGHQTPTPSNVYHYHGYSPCLATVAGDGANGASHIVGIALDGFPIYGDRDLSGNLVSIAQLDECNGITSATPEFPNGVYHYVLPSGAATKTAQAAPRCYKGTVSGALQLSVLMSGAQCVTPVTSAATSTVAKIAAGRIRSLTRPT